MALAAGNEVALARDFTEETLGVCPNVLFGRVIDATDPIDVVWENGTVAEGIPATSLDKILGDGEGATKEVVTFTDGGDGTSPEYQGVIVRRYSRQNAGAGAAPEFVLARSISTGQTWEAPAAAVEVVAGR